MSPWFVVEELVSLDGRRVPTDPALRARFCRWVEVARFAEVALAEAWRQRLADRADARRGRWWTREEECYRLGAVWPGLHGEEREVLLPAPSQEPSQMRGGEQAAEVRRADPATPAPPGVHAPRVEQPVRPDWWRVIAHTRDAYLMGTFTDVDTKAEAEALLSERVATTGQPWRLYRISPLGPWSAYGLPVYPTAQVGRRAA